MFMPFMSSEVEVEIYSEGIQQHCTGGEGFFSGGRFGIETYVRTSILILCDDLRL